MVSGDIPDGIAGGAELLNWFGGRLPSFHDAEVLGVAFDREAAAATLRVHAFEMTSEVDAKGYFVCTRHVVVTFQIAWITAMELDGFNHQNALDALRIGRTEEGEYRLDLEPAYGLGGFIQAREIAISIQPGIPAGSIYLRAEERSRE